MIRISLRIWAGVLALLLLPVFAFSSDSNNNSNSASSTKDATASANANAPSAAPAAGVPAPDPLLKLMVSQGLLTADDVAKLAGVPSSELRDRLLMILLMKNKSALSAEDMSALKAPTTEAAAAAVTDANAAKSDIVEADQPSGPPQPPASGPPSGPIPAVAPIRVLQIDPPKREGILPVLSIGKAIRIQPYGFFKASAVYDSSSPYGNDFPLPGFIGDINSNSNLKEFHVKARFARFGGNFEWLDSPNMIITGKIEADFEGNFSRVNNRNISTIRSNMFQLRLGYVRMDYKPSDNNSVFALFGQDWTPFSSSTLPNLFETTGLGVGFGTLYERDPQFRFGYNHNFGGSRNFKLGPEFAIVLPAYGNLPADLTVQSGPLLGTPIANNEGIGNQLGFGERQGVDSGKPEIQARLVAQFQLDPAKGVAPAQIIVSGVHGTRQVNILASQVPLCTVVPGGCLTADDFKKAFPSGASLQTDRNGWTGEIQLPTRFVTVIAKYWNGSDMRYYFGGELFAEFNDTTGLKSTATAQSIDGSSTLVFGLRNGFPVLAAQQAPRAQGGFVNVGVPLSRWGNADPTGRNAGWVLYLHYGYDQVLARDLRRLGGGREKGDLAAITLQYKLNNFCAFVAEQSLYRTRALPLTSTGKFPLFDGRPQHEWQDRRTEVGPLFTF